MRLKRNDLMYISYYKIPKELVKNDVFSNVSIGAKLLYGVMVDRTELSIKNNWVNNDGEIFIYYKLDEIEKDLLISRPTAIKYLKELTTNNLLEMETKDFNKPNILPITGIFQECRYNPFKDKGTGNKVYIKSTNTSQGSFTSLPTDNRLLITDFPLWLVFWGWISWLEKSKPVHHLQEDYQLVFQSPYIYPPMKAYVPLDKYFTHHPGTNLTETDKQHWHPKLEFQTETLNKFAETGPAAPKINKQKQIQIHAFYDFYFKWGGCPAPMETICDPAEQEKFPNPNNILQDITIEDPETPKEHYIYKFDERHGLLTTTAAKRLKTDSEITKYFTEYGTKDPILQVFPPQNQTQEKETKKKSQEELLQQLQLLRDHQHSLRERINRLTKRQKLFPMT